MRSNSGRREGGLKIRNEFFKKSENDKPLVSIITVCKNSERFLEDTIKSVISQTYNNIEYIIIDGGSKDKTLDIIKRYEGNIAYWLSEPDRGLYDAMNKGINIASGDWVGIINSDDWYHRDAVKLVVQNSELNPDVDVFYGDLFFPKSSDNYTRTEDGFSGGQVTCRYGTHERMLEQWSVAHPSCFVKRSIYSKYHFDQSFRLSADYDFMLSLYFANKNFFYIPESLVYFRPIGLSRKFSYRPVLELFLIRKKYSLYTAIKYLMLETIKFFIRFAYLFKKRVIKNLQIYRSR